MYFAALVDSITAPCLIRVLPGLVLKRSCHELGAEGWNWGKSVLPQVHALENTLAKLVNVNVSYGKSMKKVSSEDSVAQRMDLRSKLDRAYDKLKFKRAEEMNIAADIQQAEAKLKNMMKEGQGAQTSVEELRRRKVKSYHSLYQYEGLFMEKQLMVSF